MSPLLYLGLTLWKNKLKRFLRRPLALVLILAAIYVFVLLFVLSFRATIDLSEFIPLLSTADKTEVFGAMIFVVCLCFGALVIWGGFSSATTFFKMSDVGVLFPTPISPKKILLFGMLRQLGITIVFSIGICGFANYFHTTLGLAPSAIAFFTAAIIFSLVIAQLISMVAYIFCSRSKKLKIIGKSLVILAVLVPAGLCAAEYFSGKSVFSAIVAALSSGAMEYFPFFGWIKGMVFRAFAGQYALAGIFFVLTALGTAGIYWAIAKADCDYYEDAEEGAEAKADAVSSRMSLMSMLEAFSTMQGVGKTRGIGHGRGERALFFRQLAEYRRKNPYFIDLFTVVITVIAIVMTKAQDAEFINALIMGLTLSIFFTAQGLWTKEISKPFIYMMPGRAFTKLICAAAPSVLKFVADGIVIVTATGIAFEQSPGMIISLIPLFASAGLLFVASDILFLRMTGHVVGNKSPLRFVGIVLFFLLFAPAGAAILFFYLKLHMLIGGIIAGCAVNILVSLLIIFLCKNLLSEMEEN